MTRIAKRKQKTNRDRLRPRSLHRTDNARNLARRQLRNNGAIPSQPLSRANPFPRANQRLRLIHKKIVKLWPRLPPNLQHIFKPGRRH